MNNDMIAAGLFALAKAHRRQAHNMRKRANDKLRQNRKFGSEIELKNALHAVADIRERANLEDDKAAFLQQGARLAKIGAGAYRWNETPLAKGKAA